MSVYCDRAKKPCEFPGDVFVCRACRENYIIALESQLAARENYIIALGSQLAARDAEIEIIKEREKGLARFKKILKDYNLTESDPFGVRIGGVGGVRVGEIPELEGKKCSQLCPFVPGNTNTGTCRIDLDDLNCPEWESSKPGPQCPRHPDHRKEDKG